MTATMIQPAACTLSDVEVAKLIRAELKAAFPAVRFSVRTKSSIHITYTDGPTARRVEAIVKQFEGRSFDGMTDSTRYKGAFLYRGEWVTTYCYVFVTRHISPALARRAASQVAEYYRVGMPEVVEYLSSRTSEACWRLENDPMLSDADNAYASTLIYRAASDRTRYASEG